MAPDGTKAFVLPRVTRCSANMGADWLDTWLWVACPVSPVLLAPVTGEDKAREGCRRAAAKWAGKGPSSSGGLRLQQEALLRPDSSSEGKSPSAFQIPLLPEKGAAIQFEKTCQSAHVFFLAFPGEGRRLAQADGFASARKEAAVEAEHPQLEGPADHGSRSRACDPLATEVPTASEEPRRETLGGPAQEVKSHWPFSVEFGCDCTEKTFVVPPGL